ncbi:MAG: hypothetical protein ACKVOQ_01855 [Cyclobacteriaceae bacterium]
MKRKLYIFLTILFVLFSLQNCQENETKKNESPYKADIVSYITDLKNFMSEANGNKVEELKNAIDYTAVELYKLRTTESVIIADVNKLTGFDKVDKMKALFFVNQGKIVRSNIASFENSKSTIQHDQVILSILNMKADKGTFSSKVSFFNLVQNILIFNEFENGKLKVNGIARPKIKTKNGGRTNSCTDWYLITTYYYPNGVTQRTERYVYTTCDCGGAGGDGAEANRVDCGGNGGSGGATGTSNGPLLPTNPGNNDVYEYTDATGKYTKYQYNSLAAAWVVVDVILTPFTLVAEPENYHFLIDLPGGPLPDQVVSGDDNLIYKYDASTGNWEGKLDALGIDCASFSFIPTNSTWQEAAVYNIRFRVRFYSYPLNTVTFRDVIISKPVWFGLPTERYDGTIVQSGEASEIAAQAVQNASNIVHSMFIESPAVLTSTLENAFMKEIQLFMTALGGRADFNGSGSSQVVPRDAQYKLFGNGNCN